MRTAFFMAVCLLLPSFAVAQEPPPPQSPTLGIALFFEADGALKPETATIARDQFTENQIKAAFDLLAAGSKTLGPVLPPAAKVESVLIDGDKTAYLSFNESAAADHPGGITQEILTVGAICQTVLANFNLEGVRILVKGREMKTLAGHLDIESTITRAQCDRLMKYRRD
jgi:spore germination protein GerM